MMTRWGDVNRHDRLSGWEFMANLLYGDPEDVGDVLDHLVVGPATFRKGCTSNTFRRRRGNNVESVASTVGRGRGARWNKDRR